MEFEELRVLVVDSLNLENGDSLTQNSMLLGHVPEFDSMAVVTVIGALEDHFGFIIEDDEISADTFATMGTLYEFARAKSAAA